MQLSPHKNRFDPKEIDEWTPHHSRNTDKAEKRIGSIQRQLAQGVGVELLASKILPLHRQSTAYDGNGSYNSLMTQLGIEPRQNREDRIAPGRIIDDSDERMIQRVDDLLDETAEAYSFYTADEVRPPLHLIG